MLDKLIEDNMNLVWHMVHEKFKPYCDSGQGEDLFQVGCIGLIKAADTFNADMGVMFSTYACNCIWREIMNYNRSHDLPVHVPANRRCKFSAEDFERYRLSTDLSVLEFAIDKASQFEDEIVLRISLEQAIDSLSERKRDIIKEYFKCSNMTQTAKKFGVSYQSVQQKVSLFRKKLKIELAS